MNQNLYNGLNKKLDNLHKTFNKQKQSTSLHPTITFHYRVLTSIFTNEENISRIGF